MNNVRKIHVQALHELVVLKKAVNPWDLATASEALYKSVKVVGIRNTVVVYKSSKEGKLVEKTGDQISQEMRAIAALCVQLLNRWTDSNQGRLETHFGLPTTISNILANTNIFKNNSTTLPCISIRDVIDKYLER